MAPTETSIPFSLADTEVLLTALAAQQAILRAEYRNGQHSDEQFCTMDEGLHHVTVRIRAYAFAVRAQRIQESLSRETRQERVISGTGTSSEKRELAALVRGLGQNRP